MKNNFQKFKKVPFILSLLLLIFSLGCYIFVYKNITENDKVFKQAQGEWQKENVKRNQIQSLEKSIKALEVERALLDGHFIQISDIVPFLDTIERLAPQVKAKTEVTSVDASPTNTSLTVGVNAVGTFEGLYKFLTLLENSPYQIEFLSMNMRRIDVGIDSKDTKEPQWSVTFKIKLLSFIE